MWKARAKMKAMNRALLLPRARPDEVGVDPAGVHALLDALEREGLDVHTLMLLRHGRVHTEAAWEPHRFTDAPLVYSLSKTFASAAVGLAVADGAFGYDDRLVDLFGDVVDEAGPVASSIRVRDCLAMATGHTSDVVPTAGLSREPGRRPWARVLGQEPAGIPGQTFRYNQFATWTLAEVVRHATGRTVLELLGERVLGPLGVRRASWDVDQQGRLLGYTGLHLEPEAIAAFFQLLLDGGVRAGERLLPAKWIASYATKQVETDDTEHPDWGQGYGWQVWLDRDGGHRGDGAFGQFGVLMPAHDAVLVATASTTRMHRMFELVREHLAPAFDRPATADVAGLAERLTGLATPQPGLGRGGPASLACAGPADRWELADAGDGWHVRWVDAAGGDHRLAIGHDRWEHQTMTWGDATLRVAASGGWAPEGGWRAHLVALEAPHTLLLRLDEDGSGSVGWDGPEPLGGVGWPGLAPRGALWRAQGQLRH